MRRDAVTAFAIVTVVFWLSFAVFPRPIPPLIRLPVPGEVEALLREIDPRVRQIAPPLDRPDAEIAARVRRTMIAGIALEWSRIAVGVLSGILIARRRALGRWLALVMCAVGLSSIVATQARAVHLGAFVVLWRGLAHTMPLFVARRVLDVLFYTATLVYLTRRSKRVRFAATSRATGVVP